MNTTIEEVEEGERLWRLATVTKAKDWNNGYAHYCVVPGKYWDDRAENCHLMETYLASIGIEVGYGKECELSLDEVKEDGHCENYCVLNLQEDTYSKLCEILGKGRQR